MASRDYVIDIILRARDEMGAAIAKGTAELEGMEAAVMRNRGKFQALSEEINKTSNDINEKLQRSMEGVRTELDKTDESAEGFRRRIETIGDQSERTKKRLDKFDLDKLRRDMRQAEVGIKDAEQALKKFDSTTEASGKRTAADVAERKRLVETLKDQRTEFKRNADQLKTATDLYNKQAASVRELATVEKEHQRVLEKTRTSYEKNLQALSKINAERRKAAENPLAGEDATRGLDSQRERVMREALEQKAMIEELSGTIHTDMELDTGHFDEQAAKVEAEKTVIGSTIHSRVEMDLARAEMELAGFEAMKKKVQKSSNDDSLIGWFRQVSHEADQSKSSLSGYSSQLRGMLVFAVLVFMQQLVTVIIALGAELIAVASSAIQAGAALGGALAAGAAQALPVVGLLAGAFARLTAVVALVKQRMLEQQQQSGQTGDQAKKQADSTGQLANAQDGLRSALEGVTAANKQLFDSQVALTRARFDARRELQDLILEEKSAQLAAEGSVQSQVESRRQLQQDILTGNVSSISSDQLDVRQSALDTVRSSIDRNRASQDLGLQRSGSPLRPDTSVQDAKNQIEDAKRGLDQANRAVEQAKRGLDAAKRSATSAADASIASADKFAYMLKQLDDSERKLYYAVEGLYAKYKKVFRPITDLIVDSFTTAVSRATKVLDNPQLIGAFTDLAGSIGKSIDRITGMLTSPRWVSFFATMSEQAGKNLGPLTDAFVHIANAFRSIAEASAPFLSKMLRGFEKGAEDFQKWVGHGQKLHDFFKEANKQLDGWLDLLGSILNLFGSLISTSSGEGLSAIGKLTDAINEAADWIDAHQRKVKQFFADVGGVMSELGGLVIELGDEMLKSFNPKSVAALIDILNRILIPALGQAIRFFGRFVVEVDKITKIPGAEDVAKIAIAMVLVNKIGAPFLKLFQHMGILIRQVGQYAAIAAGKMLGVSGAAIAEEGALATLIPAMEAATGLTIGMMGAIAAGIGIWIGLSAKFGVLDDQFNAIADTFKDQIGPSIDDLNDSLDKLFKQLGFSGGGLDKFGGILKVVFVTLVKGVVVPMLRIMTSTIAETVAVAIDMLSTMAKALTGIIKIFKGVFDIIAGIVTLNGDKIKKGFHLILSGIGDIFSGFVDMMVNPIKRAFNVTIKVVEDMANAVVSPFQGIADKIVGTFDGIKQPLIDTINWIIDNVINNIPGVQIDDIADAPTNQPRHAQRTGAAAHRAHGHNLATGGRVGRQNFSIGGAVRGAVSSAGDALGGLAGKIMDVDFSFLPDWMRGLGKYVKKKMIDFAKDHTIGLPGKALDWAGGAVDDIAGTFGLAGGGHVRGPAGLDVIPANLTRDEFVVTPDGESVLENVTGFRGILNWLAKVQRPAQGFATGGRAGGGSGASGGAQAGAPKVGGGAIGNLLDQITAFGDDAVKQWNHTWTVMANKTDDSTNMIIKDANQIDKTWTTVGQSVGQSAAKMTQAVRSSMGSLTGVVFSAMSYINDTANKALKGFGADPINLTFSPPGGERKAGGGFIGMPGERSGDVVPTWLGRGEAVLNWAQQKMVDPAMRAYHGMGLADMFRRTSSEHGAGGGAGFASGGGDLYDGHPSNVAASLTKLIEIMKKRFPGLSVSSTTDHSLTTTTGGISDHSTGHAVDLASGSYPYMDKAAAWVKGSGLYKQLKQGIHNPNLAVNDGTFVDGPGFFAEAWPQHLDHIHLAVNDALRGAFGGPSSIRKLLIGGTKGPMRDLAQGFADSVRKAANKMLGKQLGFSAGAHGSHDYGGGVLSEAEVKQIIHQAEEIVGVPQDLRPGWTTMAVARAFQESTFNPDAINLTDSNAAAGHPSQGLFQTIPSTFDAYKMRGYGGITDPLANTIAAFRYMLATYGSGDWSTALSAMNGISGGYAAGGFVGGNEGKPVNITAHAGEMILNPRQQAKLAGFMGMGKSAISNFLGFTGGGGSFAGGGFVGDINHVWKGGNSSHGFGSGSPWGDLKQLPPYVVAALAEAAGRYYHKPVPGWTMSRILGHESNWKPGSMSGDQGYGLWAMTKPYADKIVAKLGGYMEQLNPVKSAAAMAQTWSPRLKDLGELIGAWHGAQQTISAGHTDDHYTGNYDIRDALGGNTFAEAIAGKKAPGTNKDDPAQTAKKIETLIGDKEFKKMLPSALKGAVDDFDGWFSNRFGVDPSDLTKRFGSYAPVLGNLYSSINNWTQDFFDRAQHVLTDAPPKDKGTEGDMPNVGGNEIVGRMHKRMAELKGIPYPHPDRHFGLLEHPAFLDCSAAVSNVLWKVGKLKKEMASGEFMNWGKAGMGKLWTVFTNPDHMFLKVMDKYWGTSVGDSGAGGLGYHPAPSASYLRGFKARHYQAGGELPGREGDALPVTAHAGEMILNRAQQWMLGGPAMLRKLFGFQASGQTSFAGGGEVGVGPGRPIANIYGLSDNEIAGNAGANYLDVVRKYFTQINHTLANGTQLFKQKGLDLNNVISGMFDGLLSDGGLLDQMATGLESITAIMANRITAMTVETNKQGRVIGRERTPEQLLGTELKQLNQQLSYMFSERGVIRKSMAAARKAIAEAQRQGDTDAEGKAKGVLNALRQRQADINTQIAGQQNSILEKMEEKLSARAQDVTDDADAAANSFSAKLSKSGNLIVGKYGPAILQRIQNAMGFSGGNSQLITDQIAILKEEQGRLRAVLQVALRQGNTDLAKQLEGQIADLAGSIAEATASLIQAAQDEIDKASARRQVSIDFGNRLADIQERYGATVAAQQARGVQLGASQANIQATLSSYSALLNNALMQGFGPDIIDPLRERVIDLTGQLLENQASIYENTIAIRQASIDSITGRQGFLGGITSSLSGIVNTLGTISGTVNTASLVQLMQSAITQLLATGEGLRNQMQTFVAQTGLGGAAGSALSALSGVHGQQFVDTLAGLDLNAIIDSLGGPDSPLAKQFESLIQAIIDNEAALQDNTNQLNELQQQSKIQSFTSSAWEWFRSAIFNGMGGLTPQYASGTPFYQAATGGVMTEDGPIHAHRGEIIVPPDFSNMLKGLVGGAAAAASMADGSFAGAPASIDFATRRAAMIQADAATGLGGTNQGLEIRALREELMKRSQTIIAKREAKADQDDTHFANKLAQLARTPGT